MEHRNIDAARNMGNVFINGFPIVRAELHTGDCRVFVMKGGPFGRKLLQISRQHLVRKGPGCTIMISRKIQIVNLRCPLHGGKNFVHSPASDTGSIEQIPCNDNRPNAIFPREVRQTQEGINDLCIPRRCLLYSHVGPHGGIQV